MPTTNNVEPTTSATERLRALLDERGVEYVDAEDGHTQHTWWSDGDHEIAASNSGERLAVYNLTPEQAVAATLGETPTPHVEDLGRLHDELRDAIVEILGNRCDWDQTGVRHAHEVLERAATLGRGTCRFEQIPEALYDDIECSECGVALWGFQMDIEGEGCPTRPRYCPNCGRKVEE